MNEYLETNHLVPTQFCDLPGFFIIFRIILIFERKNLGIIQKEFIFLRSPRIHITVSLEDRVDYILKDYDYLIHNPELNLPELLKRIEKYAGKKTCAAWMKCLGKTDM